MAARLTRRTQYALTGTVHVTFPIATGDLFYSRCLTEVTLTFEGQSEYFDNAGRHHIVAAMLTVQGDTTPCCCTDIRTIYFQHP